MPFIPLPLAMGGARRGIGDFEFPSMPPAMVLGITFAIAGNVLISFALNLQKLAHARLEVARADRDLSLEAIDEDDAASPDGEASEMVVQCEPDLTLELEREARVWNGNSPEASLSLDPRSETDPLMALPVTSNAEQLLVVPTYGALFPNTNESHVRRVGSSPLRQQPKTAKRPGAGVAANRHESNYESEYLQSKLWYVLPIFHRTARV
jgi:magnesium transporter